MRTEVILRHLYLVSMLTPPSMNIMDNAASFDDLSQFDCDSTAAMEFRNDQVRLV